jgi:large repetitive protein
MNAIRSWWYVAALCGAVAVSSHGLAGCGESGDCADGVDNDGDGLIDGDDVACAAGLDNESPDPIIPQCADSIDNDGDGLVDLQDPGCTGPDDDDEINEKIAQCKDGVDNDDDGLIDYPNDPGCDLSLDDSEGDPCPGEGCPACADGIDNDGDGDVDFPADPGCDSASDQDEFQSVSGVCGTAPVQNLPPSGMVTGTIGAGPNSLASPTCTGTGSEIVYQFTLSGPRSVEFTTAFAETTVDTVLYLRSDCMSPASELACNDDYMGQRGSRIAVPNLAPGTYYLVVDGRNSGAVGEFRLQATISVAAGAACSVAANECPAGFLCQKATAQAAGNTCEPPRCGDGRDFDGDGKNDYPDDPGCSSPLDNDESDSCPGGADCPECGNGIDDDGDGAIDYPADADCPSAAGETELLLCATESAPTLTITAPVTTGSNVDGGADFSGTCGGSSGLDRVYRLVVPGTLSTLTIDTEGSAIHDTVLYARTGTCTGTQLACNDDISGSTNRKSRLNLTNVAAGTYFVFVDALSSSSINVGDFTLNVSGTIATGQACNQAQITAGLFSCQGGAACNGTCQAP